ncbi:MAG: hypothetical protein NT000_06005 [Proteobacteria bacterium]|nr:hypothetical protein [Pseudomonadota bacterium]
MHEIFLKFIPLLLFTTSLWGVECLPKTYLQLQKENRGQKKTIVFFASWCAECSKSLKNHQPNSIFVSVFDEKKRAEAVATIFGLTHCVLDVDIAKSLGVTGVPTTKELQF